MTANEESLLDDLLALEGGLTPREMDFLDSLDHQRQRRLSEKQEDWLHRIARKVDLEA